ncbi:MAG: hypothetical protein ACI9LM_004890 [Alteromonadaceae bacterium]|jgi:hypothetical protein
MFFIFLFSLVRLISKVSKSAEFNVRLTNYKSIINQIQIEFIKNIGLIN